MLGAFHRVTFAMFLIVSSVSYAQDAMNYKIHQQYISSRAMGMGNAYTAAADDYDAVLYNPAGLARVEENEMSYFIRAGGDPKTLDFYKEVDKAGKSTDQVNAIADVINKNYGKVYGFRATPLGFLWGRKNWGMAFIPADASVDLGLNQQTGPSVNARAYIDSTLAFGYGKDVKWSRDRISWGATVKGIYRGFFDRSLPAVDLAVDKNIVRTQDIREGLTADVDLGFMYSPSTESGFWRAFKYSAPTFSLVGRNLGDFGYFSNMHLFDKATQNGPEKLGRRFDLGSSFRLPDWWVWTTRLNIDFKDMGHRYYTFEKGFHLGVEFKWKLASWFQGGWRAGMSQGFNPGKYWTAGFTGQFALFHLDLVSYAEELGTSGAKKDSRRYMANLALTF